MGWNIDGGQCGSQPKVVNLNKGNGTFEEEQVITLLMLDLEHLAGPLLPRSTGTTENFMRIGHSLLALIAAFMGGYLSRHFYAKNRQTLPAPDNPQISTSTVDRGLRG